MPSLSRALQAPPEPLASHYATCSALGRRRLPVASKSMPRLADRRPTACQARPLGARTTRPGRQRCHGANRKDLCYFRCGGPQAGASPRRLAGRRSALVLGQEPRPRSVPSSEPCCHCPQPFPSGRLVAGARASVERAAAAGPRPACNHGATTRLGPAHQPRDSAPKVSPRGRRAGAPGPISGAVALHTRSLAAPDAPATHVRVVCLRSATGKARSPPPLKNTPERPRRPGERTNRRVTRGFPAAGQVPGQPLSETGPLSWRGIEEPAEGRQD